MQFVLPRCEPPLICCSVIMKLPVRGQQIGVTAHDDSRSKERRLSHDGRRGISPKTSAHQAEAIGVRNSHFD